MLDPVAPLAPSSSPKRARPRARADPEPAAGKRSEALGEFNTAAQQVRGPAGAFLTAGEKQCASLRRWLLHHQALRKRPFASASLSPRTTTSSRRPHPAGCCSVGIAITPGSRTSLLHLVRRGSQITSAETPASGHFRQH